MWARVIEILIAVWLALSPFIFGHYPDDRALWLNDFSCALLIVVLASLSFWLYPFWRFLRRSHLAIVIVGGWLVAFSYFRGGYPSGPGYQNEIIIGLTLLLIAIIPNDANTPPPSWRRFYQQRSAAGSGEGTPGSR